ncbi:alkaline phosphatase family protein [Methylocystis bryophila]|uniref:Nucleotide pyrophosphatase n=1 Tax=Methylocystis bryophila TaxID=655015 RepID=A0A1W6MXB9_9HYPH|nr:alkaline phosphatase family protein [Methylocystis bryophila]ARN82234.1 nucleotide pyrophosphatase [Methylocystis bryophila]BDV38373.1 hypothetical protein DSM21852_16260 [Methylocystis bryophila]
MKKHILAASVAALAVAAGAARADDDTKINHVLLISIDGMHALDFINCASNSTCPNLAGLTAKGVNYLEASTSKPSDSFPGLMAIVSGGSPRTVGAYYDVAYDRVLAPPQNTTGNGVAGGVCNPNTPNGTTTEYEEGIDLDQSQLNGGAAAGQDGGIASIDATKLPRDPFNGCRPVYPWNFVRTNTIFGVIHQAGGYTAWSDKHPSYSSVAGPGNGSNLDDYYSPEINSKPVPLPVTLPDGTACSPLPDGVTSDYTGGFKNIQCYDTLKVNAILNQIHGKRHDGSKPAPVPAIFGMNFQAVSIGQKLITKSASGGYTDNAGTPSSLLSNEIQFVDASIGKMVAELKKTGDYHSTLIVITAKHGQSPVDTSRYQGVGIPAGSPITTSPATILANCLPFSESPNNPNGIGPTEDDVSLLWLDQTQQGCATAAAVSTLESASPTSANVAGVGQIFSGPGIAQMFNAPGLPKNGGDPRTPDIIVTPNIGVTYSGSSKKHAEHGGFSHDDTNVMMLLSNPNLRPATITSPVQTAQVAPTILRALGLNPHALQAVQQEGTQALPGVAFDSRD